MNLNELEDPFHVDNNRVIIKKSKEKRCKKTCKKSCCYLCCLLILLFINYLSFCFGMIYESRLNNQNRDGSLSDEYI